FEAQGARVGALGWPAPARLVDRSGLITTFGYEGEVILSAPAQVSEDAAGEVRIEATADFLVCKVDCIPGRVSLQRTLTVGDAPRASEDAPRLADARAALPRTPEEAGLSVALT